MEVTKDNYKEIYEEFAQQMGKCAFCSIDQEMTGIDLPNESANILCSADEVYQIKRHSASTFTAFQFGITLFTPVAHSVLDADSGESNELHGPRVPPQLHSEEWEVRPYNFYLRKSSGILTIAAAAVPFHVQQGSDFNKWLGKGIPYYTAVEEEQMRANTAAEEERRENPLLRVDADDIPRYATPLIAAIQEKLKAAQDYFVTNLEPPQPQELTDEEPKGFCFDVSHEDLPVTAGVSKLLSRVYAHHPLFHFTITNDDKGRSDPSKKTPALRVKVAPKREWFRRAAPLPDRSAEGGGALDGVIDLGFRDFWKVIVSSRKPIVGHNFLHDLMFMYHMHESPLPEDLKAFKMQLHQTFTAGIWDTKAIAGAMTSGSAFEPSALEKLYKKYVVECPNMKKRCFPPGFERYTQAAEKDESVPERVTTFLHEGAYDAYLTGSLFIAFCSTHPEEVQSMKDKVRAFGSSYLTSLTGEDDVIHPFCLALITQEPWQYDDVRAALFQLLSKEPSFFSGGGKPVYLRSLFDNSFECTRHFHITCKNAEIFHFVRTEVCSASATGSPFLGAEVK